MQQLIFPMCSYLAVLILLKRSFLIFFMTNMIKAYKLQFQTIFQHPSVKVTTKIYKSNNIHLSSCYWHCYNSSLTISSFRIHFFHIHALSLSPNVSIQHEEIKIQFSKYFCTHHNYCLCLLFLRHRYDRLTAFQLKGTIVRNKFSICVNKLQCV